MKRVECEQCNVSNLSNFILYFFFKFLLSKKIRKKKEYNEILFNLSTRFKSKCIVVGIRL